MTELLFSYGTLRQRDVQLSTFGRELDGRPDAIVGYELHYVTITDPRVIATSGSDRHPILKPTERPDAAVVVYGHSHQPGDRRDFYSAPEDVWAIFKTLAEERQRRQ